LFVIYDNLANQRCQYFSMSPHDVGIKKKGNALSEVPCQLVNAIHVLLKRIVLVLQKRNFIIIHAEHMFVTFSLLLCRIFCVIFNTEFDQMQWGRCISTNYLPNDWWRIVYAHTYFMWSRIENALEYNKRSIFGE
jgi:hypothetical protein